MNEASRLALPSGSAKVLLQIMHGRGHANIPFRKVQKLLKDLGFERRVNGSHHTFRFPGIGRPLNLQPVEGGKCKPRQVEQVREVLRPLFLDDVERTAA